MQRSFLTVWVIPCLGGNAGLEGVVFLFLLKTFTLLAGFKNGKLIAKYYGSNFSLLGQFLFILQLTINPASQILTVPKNSENLLNLFVKVKVMFGSWGMLITRISLGMTVYPSFHLTVNTYTPTNMKTFLSYSMNLT